MLKFILIQLLTSILLIHAMVPTNAQHAWYKLYLTLDSRLFKKSMSRELLMKNLNSISVPCSFGGSGEIYKEKAFKKLNSLKSGALKNASFLRKKFDNVASASNYYN